MLVPKADTAGGALEIVGNDTGVFFPPDQTGVILHVTGNSGLVSRTYFDSNANYALIAGRRYNGTQLAPTKVLNNEVLLRIAAQAATQATTEPAVFQSFGPARIEFVATQDQKPNQQGGEVSVYATANNTAASAAVKVATFNATTGVTATKFNGPLTGDVTGNVSGTAPAGSLTGTTLNSTVVTSSLTSVGTLTSLTLAGGTTSTYPLKFTAGTLLTTPQAGVVGYNGTTFYATPIDQERGLIPTEQVYGLDVDRSLTNNTTPQSLFGAGFHVSSGVRYRYQILCTVTKTAGNTVSIGYGLLVNGGAALARHVYRVASTVGASALTPTTVVAMRNSVTTGFATPVDVTGALVNGASGSTFDIQGVIEVTTAGYVTPQITFLNNAPTGALVLGGATIRIWPVNSTGANTVIGNWV